jgi:methylated-DNA-[protein]-cysteine S-methyltransferase
MERVIQFDTKFGRMGVAERDGGISRVFLPGEAMGEPASDEGSPLLREAARQMNEYLEGRSQVFDLPLRLEGGPFQVRVWGELSAIPFGETRTYGDIARSVGRAGAARAVGQACNRNPLPLIVPCHRVVGRGGRLIGYAGGLELKRRLLELENAIF